MKKVLILGSTGSIGCQALDIIRENSDKFCAVGLSGRSRIEKLIEQIKEFKPTAVCAGNAEDAERLRREFPGLEVYYGDEGLVELADMDCDIVLNSLMGISGLAPTHKAILNGRDIALANKETLVTGGALIMELCREKNVKLLPVDSEHSAIFQCLEGNKGRNIKRILLTASGGPFRGRSLESLADVTIEQALNHPKWSMGSKITIDSATMMNKGLEVIEAKWLFDVPAEKIDIHVHPQSIVHSMVEFEDTSVIAQLGLPDMRIPISLALNYPDRLAYGGDSLDFFTTGANLTFEKPDRSVFKCINHAYRALAEGDGYSVVMNGANEELVAMFLAGRLRFLDIPDTIEKVMDDYAAGRVGAGLCKTSMLMSANGKVLSQGVSYKYVEEILALDAEARARVRELIG